MRISLFRTFTDNRPKPFEGSWEEFLTQVIGTEHIHFRGDKLKTSAFSPAEYPDDSKRAKANVQRVWLACLDYDDITGDQLATVLDHLQDRRYVLYTSYSHNPEPENIWRVRIVLDLDTPVDARQWPAFWKALVNTLPEAPDAACKDASRIYGLPYTPNLENAVISSHEGLCLNTQEILASAPSTPPEINATENLEASIDDLGEIVKKYNRLKDPASARRARLLKKLHVGHVLAERGYRHDAVLQLTQTLDYELPTATLDSLVRLFHPSLRAMESHDFPYDDEIEVVRTALVGAREKRLTYQEERAAAEMARGVAKIKEAFKSERETPYTDEELEIFAAEAETSREGFTKRWIIQYKNFYYVYVNGEYEAPLDQASARSSMDRDLAPAVTAGVTLSTESQTGQTVEKPLGRLVKEYGTVARHALASFSEQKARYDPANQTLYQAVGRRRDLPAEYSETVDTWLKLLAGENYDSVNLWLKLLRDTTEPLVALYFEGAHGAGKSLFSAGAGRLWEGMQPTAAKQAVDEYNEGISKSPLILADECMPKAWSGRNGLSNFRSFIADRTRVWNCKFMPKIDIHGCMRVILAANNPDMVLSREMLTGDDRSAIVERLFHIHVNKEAGDYLRELGKDRVALFVKEDEMAKHIIWLEENLEATSQGRFGVKGKSTMVHDTLKYSHPTNVAVSQWIIGLLLRPDKFLQKYAQNWDTMIRYDNKGRLLVNVNAMMHQEDWAMYVSNPMHVPSAWHLSKALVACTQTKDGVPNRIKAVANSVKYRWINLDELVAYAEYTQLATEEGLMKEIEKFRVAE